GPRSWPRPSEAPEIGANGGRGFSFCDAVGELLHRRRASALPVEGPNAAHQRALRVVGGAVRRQIHEFRLIAGIRVSPATGEAHKIQVDRDGACEPELRADSELAAEVVVFMPAGFPVHAVYRQYVDFSAAESEA